MTLGRIGIRQRRVHTGMRVYQNAAFVWIQCDVVLCTLPWPGWPAVELRSIIWFHVWGKVRLVTVVISG